MQKGQIRCYPRNNIQKIRSRSCFIELLKKTCKNFTANSTLQSEKINVFLLDQEQGKYVST